MQGQFTAAITEDEEPMPPKFLTDIQDAEVSRERAYFYSPLVYKLTHNMTDIA